MDQVPVIAWPLWRKSIFRFFFIYILLNIAPWTWLEQVPGVGYITRIYYQFIDWTVNAANASIFHVKKILVPLGGSGDTSYGWAMLWLFLSIAFIGSLIWSVLDRKRNNYQQMNYWLCLFTRYYIAMVAFSYGITKLFALQMPFPNLSQLATPLGDFLPMRLSWMFMGYSQSYQVFTGSMEVLAGVLLLYRKTATLGVLLASMVFVNVLMMNLSYDIPVKIYSMQLVLMCLFLLANEYNRIMFFFILNKPASICNIYHFSYSKKWMRIIRVVFKTGFIILLVLLPFYDNWKYYKSVHSDMTFFPLKKGIYDVTVFAVNKDSIPPLVTDTLRWQDIIFDKGGLGSIKTSDTSFRIRYKRGYFYYVVDTASHTIIFKKILTDASIILSFRYELKDSSSMRLWGKRASDSIYLEIKKSNRHFQLAEKQFHWLSEANR